MAKKSMVAREKRRKYKVRVRNRCQFVDIRVLEKYAAGLVVIYAGSVFAEFTFGNKH